MGFQNIAFSGKTTIETADIKIDWGLIDSLGKEMRVGDPPPQAFTVEQFAVRIGCNTSTANKFLKKKVEAEELMSACKFGDRSHRKYYWAPDGKRA